MVYYDEYLGGFLIMVWNWQQDDWPNFTWNGPRLVRAEQKFLVGGGMLIGAARHLGNEERES